MTADALAGDRLLALVLLQQGWEDEYDQRPGIAPVGCLGSILHHERLPDGRYNLRLRGLVRVRIIEEVTTDLPYRSAHAEPMPDVVPVELTRLTQLRRKLADAVLPRFDPAGPAHAHLTELFHGEMPLGHLCDTLTYALPLPLELKQQLLGEPQVDVRADVLTDALSLARPGEPRKFPPEFSDN